MILVISLIKQLFLSESFGSLKGLPTPWPPCSSVRLEASKKVLLVHVPQETAKLQAFKLFAFFKITHFLYIILSYENSATYEHFEFFSHSINYELQFWNPLIYMNVLYIFENPQSFSNWRQFVKALAVLWRSENPCWMWLIS